MIESMTKKEFHKNLQKWLSSGTASNTEWDIQYSRKWECKVLIIVKNSSILQHEKMTVCLSKLSNNNIKAIETVVNDLNCRILQLEEEFFKSITG